MRSILVSLVVGATAGVLGWVGAVFLMNSMDSATFASIPFGWTGLIVGSVAVASIAMIMGVGDLIEPVIMVFAAAAAAAVLWQRRELPFDSRAVESTTSTNYWITLGLMAVVFVLLMFGLRSARVSNRRARG